MGEEIIREFGMDIQTLLYLKWIINKDLLYNTWSLLNVMWQPRWQRVRGEWIHVYVWLSPFAVHLKLSQHCLLISYQSSSVQSLSHFRLFATPWITAHQASLSFTNSRSSLRLTSIESVMPSISASSSLVGELRSSKPCSIAKKGKKKNKNLPKKKSPGPGGFTDEFKQELIAVFLKLCKKVEEEGNTS